MAGTLIYKREVISGSPAVVDNVTGGDMRPVTSNAVNSALNGALAELTKNKIGNVVDISSYNSESNKFTVPSDGYIITETSVGITAQTYAIIGDAVLCVARSNGNYAGHNSLFVRKGAQLYISGSNTIIIGRFYPLVA